MVSVAALGLLICVVGLIYPHFRDRRLRELRRTHYQERDSQRSKKRRRRK